MTRAEMMRRVQMLGLVLVDTVEYLDTHPECQRAICFHHKYGALYKQAVSEYESAFGPLTASAATNQNSWTWIEHPWPWEVEG